MNQDHYHGAARGWAQGATLVYAPIAALLIARTPIPLTGTRVLDVGAGTGACEAPLRAAGTATVIAADLSHDMLAWDRPAEEWPRHPDGSLHFPTKPLDIDSLLRA